MVQKLRIGIDFDNTIITYDEVFCATAKRGGLIGPGFVGRKQAVRDAIRLSARRRACVATSAGPGLRQGHRRRDNDRRCRGISSPLPSEGCAVMIVSHKTEYGHHDPDRVNLRQAARDWMAAQGLLDGEYGIVGDECFL